MKNKILKGQKGFAGSDALVAVLIIALFSGLIATISYNIFLSNSSIKRMSKATSYIIDVFEYVDKTYYDDLTAESIVNYFNNKYYTDEKSEVKMKSNAEETVNTPYSAEINIAKYNQTEGNTGKLDLVKEITMSVTYKLGNKEQKVEMKKIKTRENLTTPNEPDLSLLNVEGGYQIYPIKYTESSWIVCDKNDSSWYDYQSGRWALVIKTTKQLTIDAKINPKSLEKGEEIYAWLPRYAYKNNDIKFLFSNSNNSVETENEYKKLVPISTSTYVIPSEFSSGGQTLVGIWCKDSKVGAYEQLNKIYPLKK